MAFLNILNIPSTRHYNGAEKFERAFRQLIQINAKASLLMTFMESHRGRRPSYVLMKVLYRSLEFLQLRLQLTTHDYVLKYSMEAVVKIRNFVPN